MQKKDLWYQSWFDTPFYHQLYSHRDKTEAERFMTNLMRFLDLPKTSEILDLPCGKGRHSVFLNRLGYNVYGADLSVQSINAAKEFENEKLSFFIHDMKEALPEKYDAVLNLFTSFGYFDEEENIEVLKNFVDALNPSGVIVIDFLNINRIQNTLVANEVVKREHIDFKISRSIEDQNLIKKISFDTNGRSYEFEERVKCIDLEKFREMGALAGLKIKHTFGDYDLNPYHKEDSDRLIIIFE